MPIRILQITDCHLGREKGHTLAGMDTDASLQAVLEEMPLENIDLVLATGDLADHGTPEAYSRLKEYMDALPVPVYYLPGNHDDKQVMSEVLANGEALPKVVEKGNWKLLLLDSTIDKQVGGYFEPAELEFTEQQLESDTFTMAAFHHPLMAVGCHWLDQQQVSNAADFIAIAEKHSQLKLVVCGHVHQVFESKVGSAPFLAAPSTCAQFAPGSNDFRIDDINPGWRLIELFDDGSIRSEVGRLSRAHSVDLECGGYA